jgi:hypothetical protein
MTCDSVSRLFRTTKTSSGTRNALATSNATGTPPRGSPSTMAFG